MLLLNVFDVEAVACFNTQESITSLQMQLEEEKVVVDKKQRDFSMKKMIRRLHIKEPAEHVMAILGKK